MFGVFLMATTGVLIGFLAGYLVMRANCSRVMRVTLALVVMLLLPPLCALPVARFFEDQAAVARNIYYRQGQIDAANGQMLYELVRNENGEVVWRVKK